MRGSTIMTMTIEEIVAFGDKRHDAFQAEIEKTQKRFDELYDKCMSWDMVDANELCDWLNEMKQIERNDGSSQYIDTRYAHDMLDELPSAGFCAHDNSIVAIDTSNRWVSCVGCSLTQFNVSGGENEMIEYVWSEASDFKKHSMRPEYAQRIKSQIAENLSDNDKEAAYFCETVCDYIIENKPDFDGSVECDRLDDDTLVMRFDGNGIYICTFNEFVRNPFEIALLNTYSDEDEE